ncbi:MAG TPA: PAS domain S-box protein, partial [Chroococcidiopsis sp.]
ASAPTSTTEGIPTAPTRCAFAVENGQLVGLLTERDIVQICAQPRPLTELQVQDVCSRPAVTLRESALTDVKIAFDLLQQHNLDYLPVVGDDDALVGVVTQASLLRALNPLTLCQLTEQLEDTIAHLEREKNALLEEQASELEQHVAERTAALEKKAKQEQILATVATQIRSSLNIQDILDTTVQEVRSLLNCDRVTIYQFHPKTGATVVATATATSATTDSNPAESTSRSALIDYVEPLGNETMRVPIMMRQQLWGLMTITFSHSEPVLTSDTIELVRQLTIQLAIAIQQSTTYQKATIELEERKRTEARLRESERRYSTLAAVAPVGIFRTDADGNCLYVNERWCELTGLNPEEALGMGWSQALHPDNRDAVFAEWYRAAQDCTTFDLEYQFQRPDGTVTWVYGQSVAEQDETGRIIGYVGTVTDISDRKRSEEALRQSEAHQRALISAIPDLIMRLSRTGIYLEFVATPNFHVVGVTTDIVGTHVCESLPPVLAQRRIEYMEKALQTKTIQVYEQDLSIGDITQVEEVRVVPYGDDEVLMLVRDISDRKQAELALKQSEAQSRAVLAAIPDLMFRVGADGIYRGYITPHRALDVFPQTFNPVGLSMAEVLPPELSQRHLEAISKALETGELQVYEHQIQVGDRHQDEEIRVVRSGDDEVLFMIRDITDRKQAEAALKQSELTNRTIIGTIPDLLIQMDRHGHYNRMLGGSGTYVKQAYRVSDMPELYNILPPELADQRLHYANQAIETKRLQVYEQVLEVEGEQRFEEVRIAPLNDNEVLVIVRDMTERKRSEAERLQAERALQELNLSLELKVEERTAELRASEAQIRAMIEAIPDLLLRVTRDGYCLDYIHSRNQEAVFLPIQQHLSEVLPTELLDQQLGMIERAIATGTLQVYEHQFFKNDRLVYEEVRVVSIGPDEALVIVRDVTYRKQTELENRLLKERLQFLLSSSPAIIYSCKASNDYGTTFISENVQAILGYTAEDFVTEPTFWVDHIHPDDAPRIFSERPLLFEQGIHKHEYRFLHRRGYYVWLRDEMRLVRDNQGNPSEIIGYFADISDIKKIEDKLAASEAKFRQLVEGATDLIWASQSDGTISYLSPQLKTLFGLEPDEWVGKFFGTLVHPSDRPTVGAMIVRIIATGQPSGLHEFRYLTQSGDYAWVQTNAIPTKNSKGVVIALQGILSDISDRKQAEAQLKQTNEELVRATRLKDEFLANMSHELRTPLNAILGMTEGLQEQVFGEINPQQRKALQTVERSGSHLLELINDILDVAKIESGQMVLERLPTSVAPLCRSSLAFIKQQALKKRIQLEIKLSPHLPDLLIDERRIRQVLINLLNNAVKFTPEGGQITLEASRMPVAQDAATQDTATQNTATQDTGTQNTATQDTATAIAETHYLRISVIDTGI